MPQLLSKIKINNVLMPLHDLFSPGDQWLDLDGAHLLIEFVFDDEHNRILLESYIDGIHYVGPASQYILIDVPMALSLCNSSGEDIIELSRYGGNFFSLPTTFWTI